MEEHPDSTPPETEGAAAETGAAEQAPPFPVQEEVDLNELYPEAGQDLNDLFPEKELRTLLRKVHKSKADLHKINSRFVDNTEHVVPHLEEDPTDPDEPGPL